MASRIGQKIRPPPPVASKTAKHGKAPNQLAAVEPNSLPHTISQGPMAESFCPSQVRSRISATTESAALRVPHSTAKNQYSASATPGVVISPRGAIEVAENTSKSRPRISAKRKGEASSHRLRCSSGFTTDLPAGRCHPLSPARNKHLPARCCPRRIPPRRSRPVPVLSKVPRVARGRDLRSPVLDRKRPRQSEPPAP